MGAECWWRRRCATCAHYRETMAVGLGVGVCTRDAVTTCETDSCEHHSGAAHE